MPEQGLDSASLIEGRCARQSMVGSEQEQHNATSPRHEMSRRLQTRPQQVEQLPTPDTRLKRRRNASSRVSRTRVTSEMTFPCEWRSQATARRAPASAAQGMRVRWLLERTQDSRDANHSNEVRRGRNEDGAISARGAQLATKGRIGDKNDGG